MLPTVPYHIAEKVGLAEVAEVEEAGAGGGEEPLGGEGLQDTVHGARGAGARPPPALAGRAHCGRALPPAPRRRRPMGGGAAATAGRARERSAAPVPLRAAVSAPLPRGRRAAAARPRRSPGAAGAGLPVQTPPRGSAPASRAAPAPPGGARPVAAQGPHAPAGAAQGPEGAAGPRRSRVGRTEQTLISAAGRLWLLLCIPRGAAPGRSMKGNRQGGLLAPAPRRGLAGRPGCSSTCGCSVIKELALLKSFRKIIWFQINRIMDPCPL